MLLQPQSAPCSPSDIWELLGRASSVISILGVFSIAFGIISVWKKLKNVTQQLFSERSITAIVLKPAPGFKGLICCVSAPLPARKASDSPEAILDLIDNGDSLTDELRRGPIGSILKAIELHERDLKHCWLIASTESKPYCKALEKACKKYFQNFDLHTVTVEDVYVKIDSVYEAVQNIFSTCEAETKLLPSDIITDVTGGNKIMSIAVAMACLDSNRQIEYIEQKEWKTFYKIDVSWEKLITQRRKAS